MQSMGGQVEVISCTEVESVRLVLKLQACTPSQNRNPLVGVLVKPFSLCTGKAIGMD